MKIQAKAQKPQKIQPQQQQIACLSNRPFTVRKFQELVIQYQNFHKYSHHFGEARVKTPYEHSETLRSSTLFHLGTIFHNEGIQLFFSSTF